MSVEIQMPKLGLTMKTGKVSKWFVSEGACVRKGDDLFEVETDKITNKVECPEDGVLFQILVQPKQVVPVGTVLGILGAEGEKLEKREASVSGSEISEKKSAAPKKEKVDETPKKKTGPVLSSPAAKRLAKELGIALENVKGSGPNGRIAESDVRAYKEALSKIKITPLAAVIATKAGLDFASIKGSGEAGKIMRDDVERILHPERFVEKPKKPAFIPANAVGTFPLEGMRKVIADNMQASLQNAAQLTLVSEADVTECVALIDDLKALHKNDKSFRLSMNDVLIMAVAKTLKKHIALNSTCDGENITRYREVNMGMAVALPQGLVVPVIPNADTLNLLEIAKKARALAKKAKDGELMPDDMSGGTFTITNMCHSVVDFFTPVLNVGETGILGLGRVVQKPVVRNGEIVIRSMMGLSLTFDHRIVDGAPAAEFLKTLEAFLADPTLLIL